MSTETNPTERLQKDVDLFFRDVAENGYDEQKVRRKVEDSLRKARRDEPTKFRRALYTMVRVLNLTQDDFKKKDPAHYEQ